MTDLRDLPITPVQFMATIAATLMVQTFSILPYSLAIRAGTAAPWAILLAGALALLLVWPMITALARRPGKNLTDLALEAGGRPLAVTLALVFGFAVIFEGAMALRQISEMVITSLYPHTPQTFALVAMISVGAITAAASPSTIFWVSTVYVGPALGAILVVLLGNLGWIRMAHLVPMTGPGILPVLGRSVLATSFLGELAYMGVYARHLTAPKQLPRIALGATGITAITWAVVTAVCLMVLPLPGSVAIPFPMLELTRLVQGGRFLERVDALWIIFWAFGSAALISGPIQTTSMLIADAFRLPDRRDQPGEGAGG